jgi:hypothetical protein
VKLEPGTYSVEWFGVDHRETVDGGDVTAQEVGPESFEPTFEGSPSVLYLTAT